MQLAHANRLRIKPVAEIRRISRLLHATEYDEADSAENGYRGEDQPQSWSLAQKQGAPNRGDDGYAQLDRGASSRRELRQGQIPHGITYSRSQRARKHG